MAPPALLDHVRRADLDGEHRADEVDLQDGFPLVLGLLEDAGRAAGDAGIGVDDVEPAVGLQREVDELLHVGGIARVHLHCDGLAAGGVDAGGDRCREWLAALSAAITLAPSAANSMALARPMPEAAPVTMTDLPVKRLHRETSSQNLDVAHL